MGRALAGGRAPGPLRGVTEAIGEVGGYSVTIGGRRLYLVQTAERGIAWLRLTAQGTAGHGAMVHPDNAVTELAGAVARIGRHEWPLRLTPPVRAFLEGASEPSAPIRPGDPGRSARPAGADFADHPGCAPQHGQPDRPEGGIQGQRHPAGGGRGDRRAFPARVRGRVPGRDRQAARARSDGASSSTRTSRVETSADGDLYEAMTAALLAEDPEGRVVPYTMFGGTDAKSFSRLGIRCFGFAPLRLPAGSGLFRNVPRNRRTCPG